MDLSARDAALRSAFGQVSKLWWLWIVFGVFWIVVALVILQFDRASITTVGVLIGLMFLASGFQQIAISGLIEGAARWISLFFGVLLLVAGVIALISPEDTFAGVADILGFLFLMVGFFWILQAFMEREGNELWWFGLVAGIAMIVLAFWTGGQFFIERSYMLLVFAGIWALFHGVGDLITAFQIRRLSDVPPPRPPTEPPADGPPLATA
jgi:uncharacterized membrane protein HdeD (DUF308 family)